MERLHICLYPPIVSNKISFLYRLNRILFFRCFRISINKGQILAADASWFIKWSSKCAPTNLFLPATTVKIISLFWFLDRLIFQIIQLKLSLWKLIFRKWKIFPNYNGADWFDIMSNWRTTSKEMYHTHIGFDPTSDSLLGVWCLSYF
jgi:hypothetical protein